MDIQEYIQSGVIESYVLGLASAEEAAELERLSEQYPEVQVAMNNFATSLEQQAFRDAITPPAGTKEKIMAAIANESKEDKPVFLSAKISDTNSKINTVDQNANSNQHAVPVRNLFQWRMAAAASIILFITSAILNIVLYNKYQKNNSQYQALLNERSSLQASNNIYQAKLREWQSAAEMMANPKMAMIKMLDPKGKAQNMATLFWDTRTKDVYILPNKLPKPTKDKQYQLWALVDGKPVNAGMLDPECSSVCQMKNIQKAQAFAITLEDKGGSETPTLEQMYVMGKV